MAFKTVSQLQDSVAAILSGIDIQNVDDRFGAFERAARTMVQKADIPEASGQQNITLYAGVTDYLCDSKIFGTAINDIRPQGVSRNITDFVYKQPGELFDRTYKYNYNGTHTTFEYQNGTPIIRISSKLPTQQIIIDPMNSTTGWVTGGTASGLAQDTTVFYASPASLRFTLTGSGAGTLTKTLTNALDLSAYEGIGVTFLAMRMPQGTDPADLTSVAVKLGSDSGNYAEVTATEGFLGSWTAGDWLLVAFNFANAVTTGTPDWSNIIYVQVVFNHTATMINFNVGGLWNSLPTPAQILYQSCAIFKTATGQPTETITTVDDQIILSAPAYNLYLYESALAVLQQTGAGQSDATYMKLSQIIDGNGSTDIGLYARYRGDNPSEELRQSGSWYDANDRQNFGNQYW